jgi:uncharacterized membrane protein
MFRVARILIALLVLVSLSAFSPAPQTESGNLMLFTAYPAQEVRAGESVSISLELRGVNVSPQIVQLDLRDVPDGWRATLQGGGRVVRSVFVDPESTQKVNLNVEFPDNVTDGAYRLTVIARGQGVQAQLPLEFIVGSSLPPRLSATVDLPIVRGTPNSTFTYRLKVKNDSDQDAPINLDFEAPTGFTVTFREAGQEVTSVPIKAGQTGNIDVNVRTERETPAGEYPILVRVRSDQAADEVNLTAAVRGNFELALTAPDGRLSGRATAGQETPLELILRNTGTAPATEVRLEASSPAQWSVSFEPAVITGLAPDAEVQVKALIKPPDKAIAGDYMVTLRAVPTGGSSESVEFRITVETSTWWGIVGLVLIAAALGVVTLAVSRFGRR